MLLSFLDQFSKSAVSASVFPSIISSMEQVSPRPLKDQSLSVHLIFSQRQCCFSIACNHLPPS